MNDRIEERKLGSLELVSLFAGAGGLDLGLERAGFTARTLTDISQHACETLRRNKQLATASAETRAALIDDAMAQRCFRRLTDHEKARFFARLKAQPREAVYLASAQIIEGDIRKILSRELWPWPDKRPFAVAGGPPCQPFSKAGQRKSVDCTKNGDLFYQFVRVVEDLRPNWFIFENVKGITFTRTDVLYISCDRCGQHELAEFRTRQDFRSSELPAPACASCGSDRTRWLIVGEKGGSLRIIVREFERLGYRCEAQVLNAADFGAPQIRERLFIVGSLYGVPFSWPKPTHHKPPMNGKQPDLFGSTKTTGSNWRTIYDALWSRGHSTYGQIDCEQAVLWVKNVVRPHDEPVTWHLGRPSPTVGAHQGAKFALAPNGVPEAQLARQQWHTLGRRQSDMPPVAVEHEYLTDEELLVLQTFPQWWYLHGTRMERAFQIGNAVPPVLGEAVGNAVLRAQHLWESSVDLEQAEPQEKRNQLVVERPSMGQGTSEIKG